MISALVSSIDPQRILDDANLLQYKQDGTGMLMAFNPNDVDVIAWMLRQQMTFDGIIDAIIEIEGLTGKVAKRVMLNRLPSGIEVPWHVDPGERYERWHLPVKMNSRCGFQVRADEAKPPEILELGTGWWTGPIPYWVPHRVWNLGDGERVHLIVDLE